MATVTDIAMWSKSHPAFGQRRRVQRNYYAFLVTMVLTAGDMVCPACSNPLDLDTAEVDRAIPSLDYRPGNITYLCRGCNQGRGILQSVDKDWSMVDMYAAHIADASRSVPIPTEREAMAWWTRRPTVVTHPRYA